MNSQDWNFPQNCLDITKLEPSTAYERQNKRSKEMINQTSFRIVQRGKRDLYTEKFH